MIDSHIMEQLEEAEQRIVESAILSLYNSGILELQKRANLASVLHGADDEEPETLAARILQYRKSNTALESFRELGKRIKDENNA
jgi:hypothetical protein